MDGERAHRTALASLKHSFEKVGDHWEPKEQRGPSDAQAEGGVDGLVAWGGTGAIADRALVSVAYPSTPEAASSGWPACALPSCPTAR